MINRVIIVGRLTRDPELRSTPSGVNVLTFTLAFDNKNKNADGTRGTSFINCTAWRQLADFVSKYCKKGSQIGVEGSLQERKYQRRDPVHERTVSLQYRPHGRKAGRTSGGGSGTCHVLWNPEA